MAKKYQNKQEALRIRVYNFYNDHKSKGKMLTINHFKLEKLPEIILEQIKTRRNFLIKNYFSYYQM